MARIVLRTKHKFGFNSFVKLFFFMVFCSYLFSTLFIKPLNVKMMIDIQNMSLEVESLKKNNQKLTIEIQSLQNRDRIYTIAEDAGLKQNQDNIISVTR